ncbi:MAG: DUF1272 domain-containing protein [Candidatus Lutacidiplasmatales archaeon]
MGVLGRKWTLWILREAGSRNRATFGELLRSHPRVSRRLLSKRLKELQREGYLERIASDGKPRKVGYAITEKGRDAMPLVLAFSNLVARYGEGVPVAPGLEVSVEDICFEHPEIRAARFGGGNVRREAPPTGPSRIAVMVYKDHCEKCQGNLPAAAEAYTCSFSCTWCPACARAFGGRCPNCQGILQIRPPLPTRGPDRGSA